MTPGRELDEALAALDARVSALESEGVEWVRQRGVMAACWPYALPAPPRPFIPAQRRPDPRETVHRPPRTGHRQGSEPRGCGRPG